MSIGCTWEKTGIDVLVIGGGAAGIMAGLQSASAGARTLLLEKNEKLGKKIYITGKGRCNVTNTADGEDFFRQVPRNAKFLYPALSNFGREELLRLLAENGTDTKTERGGRVFPVSDRASDVTRALERALARAGGEVRLHARVVSLQKENGAFLARLADGHRLCAAACVVATGGISYPLTGSTGDGYRFAREAGHTIVPTRGALVPLVSGAEWPARLQGLSLKNVRLSARQGKKKLFDEMGEMLFTHFGYSGPLILTCSSHLPEDLSGVELALNLKPGMDAQQLDARILREIAEAPRSQLLSLLQTMLPRRMAPVFAELCGLDARMPAGRLNRAERRAITEAFQALPLPLSGFRPAEEAIITRGGVSVQEVLPGAMMSRRCPGLFFAGEVLDVDAHTGGFNLQIAFSTGALAGKCAAAYAMESAAASLAGNG